MICNLPSPAFPGIEEYQSALHLMAYPFERKQQDALLQIRRMGNDMHTNVGKIDRVLRLLIGIALIAAPLLNFMGLGATAWAVYVMVAVGAVLTVTSVVGICPLYSLIGVKTSDA